MKSSKRIFSGGGYNRRKTFPRLRPGLSPATGELPYPGTSKEARVVGAGVIPVWTNFRLRAHDALNKLHIVPP